jgi:hypothetical protein
MVPEKSTGPIDHVGGAAAGAAAGAGVCAGGVESCAGVGVGKVAVASGAELVAAASGVAAASDVRPDAGKAMDNPTKPKPRRKHVERAFNLILLSIK